jgi:hypothetical protein
MESPNCGYLIKLPTSLCDTIVTATLERAMLKDRTPYRNIKNLLKTAVAATCE